MKFTVVTPPACDPISLAEAKAHCRVTSVDEDGLLVGYILAARQHVETICGIALITQTLAASFDHFCDLELPRWPVQSVSSITYLDNDAVVQTLDSGIYLADTKARPSYVTNSYTGIWPGTYYQRNAVTVNFVAGYGSSPGDIPEPIRQAMLLLIGAWYEQRESVSAQSLSELPGGVASLLASYRVYY